MNRTAPFKDQRFMLAFMYSSSGMLTENIPHTVVDEEGNSLVISGRSGRLEAPGTFVGNPGIIMEAPTEENKASLEHMWFNYKNLSPERLLKFYGGNEEAVRFVREVGEIGDKPCAKCILVLAYDDGEAGKPNHPQLVELKRGGFELVIEYLLSKYTDGPYDYEDSGSVRDFLCDDGQVRRFNFALELRLPFRDLHNEEYHPGPDFDDDFWTIKRTVHNVDEDALRELCHLFIIPPRMHLVLTSEQEELLEKKIPEELGYLSDFIGIRLFKQDLPRPAEGLLFFEYERWCRSFEFKRIGL